MAVVGLLNLLLSVLISAGRSRDAAAAEAPFNHPTDIAVAPDGTIFVADGYGNSRVHVFLRDGDYLRGWGEHGRRPGQFRVPNGIAVDMEGRVYVADRENDRVQVFDASGKVLHVWAVMCFSVCARTTTHMASAAIATAECSSRRQPVALSLLTGR